MPDHAQESDPDAVVAFDIEIARRLAELDAGTAPTVSWPEARLEILEDADAPASDTPTSWGGRVFASLRRPVPGRPFGESCRILCQRIIPRFGLSTLLLLAFYLALLCSVVGCWYHWHSYQAKAWFKIKTIERIVFEKFDVAEGLRADFHVEMMRTDVVMEHAAGVLQSRGYFVKQSRQSLATHLVETVTLTSVNGSEYYALTASADDPQTAIAIANAVADAYLNLPPEILEWRQQQFLDRACALFPESDWPDVRRRYSTPWTHIGARVTMIQVAVDASPVRNKAILVWGITAWLLLGLVGAAVLRCRKRRANRSSCPDSSGLSDATEQTTA